MYRIEKNDRQSKMVQNLENFFSRTTYILFMRHTKIVRITLKSFASRKNRLHHAKIVRSKLKSQELSLAE
jgi:hypothetical protein